MEEVTKEILDIPIERAIEEAFEKYADGTNDIEVFEKGFRAGLQYMGERMMVSLAEAFKIPPEAFEEEKEDDDPRQMPSWFV